MDCDSNLGVLSLDTVLLNYSACLIISQNILFLWLYMYYYRVLVGKCIACIVLNSNVHHMPAFQENTFACTSPAFVAFVSKRH